MNVYRVRADLAYGMVAHAGDEDDHDEISRCMEAAGKPSAAGWRPPHLEDPPGDARTLPVDCIAAAAFGSQAMLLSQRARAVLAPLLLPCGEYLPVRIDGSDYCWFNCTTLVDAADQDRIEGERSKHRHEPPDCWNTITRWAFHPDRLADTPAIFTVPQWSFHPMCTDVLREAVEAHDLLGFQFDLLWSPEHGGVEINDSPTQFLGEAGRQWTIAAKARRKAMQACLAARAKSEAAAASPT